MKFSSDECGRRIDAVREVIARQDLDAALLHSPDNLYYFSGFRTMLYTRFIAVVVTADNAVLVVPTVDEKLASEELWSPVWLDNIALWGPDDRSDVYPSHMVALEHLLEGPSRVGVDELTLAEYNVLSSSLKGIEFVDLHDDIMRIRAVKSIAERELLAGAQRTAIAGLKELANRFTSFDTERDIGVFLDNFAAEHHSDGHGYPTLVSCGSKIGAPHSPPLDRPLVEGELIRVAYGPAFSGYTADIVRTFNYRQAY